MATQTAKATATPPAAKQPGSFSKKMRKLVRNGWLSDQHGAWAMIIVPLLVGSAMGGWAWPQLILSFAWLMALLFFNAFGLWIKARGKKAPTTDAARARIRRRQSRYVPALLTYGGLAGAGALYLVFLQPSLLWWVFPLAVVFPVALWEMWVGRDRSMLARGSAIVASSFMTPIAFSLGAAPTNWLRVWIATAYLVLYFLGTVPLVKAMIRERNNPIWRHSCTAYHLIGLAILAGLAGFSLLSWWLVAAWVVLAVRAYIFPFLAAKRPQGLRPATFGFTEFAVSLMVVLVLLLPSTLT